MTKLAVYDPPMCCSTGVCGPAVDPVLPRVSADLDWLKRQGVQVERYNLAQQPQAFASNPTVTAALREHGNDCLPLVLVDGEVASRGTYPDRAELARLWRASMPLPKSKHRRKRPPRAAPPASSPSAGPLEVRVSAANFRRCAMVIPGPVTRNLFFTGKGGVGKTSVASATAVGSGRQRQAGAPGEHRPGLKPGRGLSSRAGHGPHPGSWGDEPLGDEHRPGGRGPRLP